MQLGVARRARREAGRGDALHGFHGNRLVGRVEHARLVHVVPEAGDPHRGEAGVERAPPVPHVRAGEVGEHARPRPNLPREHRAVAVADEGVGGDAAVVGGVALPRQLRDVQIGDDHRVEALPSQLRDEAGQVGVRRRVHGEGAVAVLEADVEPDDVGREAVAAQA